MTIPYETFVQEALRGVVKSILNTVVKDGLSGLQHFYISLKTDHPGVVFPDAVKRTNPAEVTIVLQHQFWDLTVEESGFSVVLTFQNIPQKIYIPFGALLSFVDPSARFGLHFTPSVSEKPMPSSESVRSESAKKNVHMQKSAPEKPIATEKKAQVISFQDFRRTHHQE